MSYTGTTTRLEYVTVNVAWKKVGDKGLHEIRELRHDSVH